MGGVAPGRHDRSWSTCLAHEGSLEELYERIVANGGTDLMRFGASCWISTPSPTWTTISEKRCSVWVAPAIGGLTGALRQSSPMQPAFPAGRTVRRRWLRRFGTNTRGGPPSWTSCAPRGLPSDVLAPILQPLRR